MKTHLSQLILFILSGILFGFGIQLSGMTNPETVIRFLNMRDGLQIDLVIVLISAITTVFLMTTFFRSKANKAASPLPLWDKKLMLGASIFGVGWGLSGLCPGSAIAAMANGNLMIFTFILPMVTIILFIELIKKRDK